MIYLAIWLVGAYVVVTAALMALGAVISIFEFFND